MSTTLSPRSQKRKSKPCAARYLGRQRTPAPPELDRKSLKLLERQASARGGTLCGIRAVRGHRIGALERRRLTSCFSRAFTVERALTAARVHHAPPTNLSPSRVFAFSLHRAFRHRSNVHPKALPPVRYTICQCISLGSHEALTRQRGRIGSHSISHHRCIVSSSTASFLGI